MKKNKAFCTRLLLEIKKAPKCGAFELGFNRF